MVPARAAGRVPLAGADEPVRRTARTAVRDRREAPCGAGEPDNPRGARGIAAAPQALPVVLFDPPGQRADVALPAGRPRFPARLFPPQERRLEEQSAAPARGVE